jgi:uncharacterized damage-inducible protein DinB
MGLIKHLRRLFTYDDWANREVLNALQASTPPARSVKLLAHILSAKKLWMQRILAQQQTLPVWPDFTVQQCATEVNEQSALWNEYLEGLSEAELARLVQYKNSKGEPWTSNVDDILLHVITHSAYHRGQIASDMRSAGMNPAYTDFIHAVRQHFVE